MWISWRLMRLNLISGILIVAKDRFNGGLRSLIWRSKRNNVCYLYYLQVPINKMQQCETLKANKLKQRFFFVCKAASRHIFCSNLQAFNSQRGSLLEKYRCSRLFFACRLIVHWMFRELWVFTKSQQSYQIQPKEHCI